jgi:hypothetical protein
MSMVSESLAATVQDAIGHAALAETMLLDEIDVSNPSLYQRDVWQPYFSTTSGARHLSTIARKARLDRSGRLPRTFTKAESPRSFSIPALCRVGCRPAGHVQWRL